VRFQENPVRGFTTIADNVVRELKNEISVSEAYDPQSGAPAPITANFICVWDTGSTDTVITSKIVNSLNLKPSGRAIVKTVGQNTGYSEHEVDTYLVNIILPNKVGFVGIRVSEGGLEESDVLIGMDIICRGDFAISNWNGKTCWTFRYPSIEKIDFVKEIRNHNLIFKSRISSMKRKKAKKGK